MSAVQRIVMRWPEGGPEAVFEVGVTEGRVVLVEPPVIGQGGRRSVMSPEEALDLGSALVRAAGRAVAG